VVDLPVNEKDLMIRRGSGEVVEDKAKL